MKECILDYSQDEIIEKIQALSHQKYRALQLYKGLTNGFSFEEITTLPKDLIAKLRENYDDKGCSIFKRIVSKIDGTEKYLFKLNDNNIVEGVLMKYKHGNTVCISTQVGCRMGCDFCASGIDGLIRNLTPGEMLSEVIEVNALIKNVLKDERGLTNIVLMGSGEPLDNYDNVLKFLRLVNSENGLNISKRNISLSTSGIVPRIYDLAKSDFPLVLTISLHAATDEVRKMIMPVAKKYSIEELIERAKYYFEVTKRRVIFEYALINGVNNTKEMAEKLSKLLRGFSCHVNIINLNKVKEKDLESSTKKAKDNFIKILTKNNISNSTRRVMGEDINGACGQLRRSVLKK